MKHTGSWVSVTALTILLLVGCKEKVKETGEIPAASCEEMLPLCEEMGLPADQCCNAEDPPDACSGSVVTLSLGSTERSSDISAQDCFDRLDEVPDIFCRARNRPGNCRGGCENGRCQNAGEATDKMITQNGPPMWECRATQGRCFCDCR